MQEDIRDNALLLNEEDGFTEDAVEEEDDETEVGDDEEGVEETASWEN